MEIAQQDERVFLITGDLGFGVLNEFASSFPKQFLNAGIAEQNMTGLAVGMALEGRIVFTYSICNFPTFRCLEQIRNDAAYHKANVKIVSVGAGFSYGALGFSHHAIEDLAVMRAIPGVTVVSPGDPIEVAQATHEIYKRPGTCYLRLGKGGELQVHSNHQEKNDFQIGKAIQILEGSEIVIFATGGILKNAYDAALTLQKRNLNVGLYSFHTLKPVDIGLIQSVASKAKVLITVEEHSLIGGLGSVVAEVTSQMVGRKSVLKMLGINDSFPSMVGDQAYLRDIYGLSVEGIVNSIQEMVKNLSEI
jgi:transketolase